MILFYQRTTDALSANSTRMSILAGGGHFIGAGLADKMRFDPLRGGSPPANGTMQRICQRTKKDFAWGHLQRSAIRTDIRSSVASVAVPSLSVVVSEDKFVLFRFSFGFIFSFLSARAVVTRSGAGEVLREGIRGCAPSGAATLTQCAWATGLAEGREGRSHLARKPINRQPAGQTASQPISQPATPVNRPATLPAMQRIFASNQQAASYQQYMANHEGGLKSP